MRLQLKCVLQILFDGVNEFRDYPVLSAGVGQGARVPTAQPAVEHGPDHRLVKAPIFDRVHKVDNRRHTAAQVF